MSIEKIRESGLLELYIIGDLEEVEVKLVEDTIEKYPILKQDLQEIEITLERYALQHAIEPPATVKPMMFAVLDYTQRMEAGEAPSSPPALHRGSKISDFSEWLDREDLQEADDYDAMHGKIIGASEERTTLIVWLRYGAPDEVHTDEIEKFLVVEGTCNITIGDTVHSLRAGDNLAIPLFINHRVEVTSSFPCKVILERAAA